MKALISRSEFSGRVRVPSSKSYTIRGLMCAALAKGESHIVYPLHSDDTRAANKVLCKVGCTIQESEDCWQVSGGNFREPTTELHCGDSAATLRFMTAICSLIPGTCRLTAGSSLSKRPVQPLIDALQQLGVNCSCQDGKAPVIVDGGLRGGITEISGDISSQFVSALLLISPLAEKDVTIKLTTPLESKPFVMMTLECMREFGIEVNYNKDFREFYTAPQSYKSTRYTVEGDWSSASYLLALGAIGGRTITENLNPKSQQGDKIILELLREMGAMIEIENNAITVNKSSLKAIRTDLTDYIDLLPTIAVLTATAKGTSELIGIKRARIKESNRVATVREGLERMGVKVIEENDKLTIIGSDIKGSVIDSHDDHRIAMAFSILGSIVGETTIENAKCVSKTFPNYWDVFQNIGGKVKLNGK